MLELKHAAPAPEGAVRPDAASGVWVPAATPFRANLAIDFERVEGRREAIIDDLGLVYDLYDKQATSPEAYALAADRAKQIERALASLPKRTREMVVMVRLQGMTHQEVANQLGVSKSLVDKYVLQALLRCRDILGGLDKLD